MKSEEEILVDLDGTLAEDVPGEVFDPVKIGKPIPRMVKRIKEHIALGQTVKIFTARASTRDHHTIFDGTPEEYRQHVIEAIQAWTLEHIGEALEVTCEKDYRTKIIYDDRARQVVRNEGTVVGLIHDSAMFSYRWICKFTGHGCDENIENMPIGLGVISARLERLRNHLLGIVEYWNECDDSAPDAAKVMQYRAGEALADLDTDFPTIFGLSERMPEAMRSR